MFLSAENLYFQCIGRVWLLMPFKLLGHIFKVY